MIRVILCDDDSNALIQLHKILEHILPPTTQYHFCQDGQALFSALQAQPDTNLIFMDIELADENGVDLASKVFSVYPNIPVLFMTSYNARYSQQIFLQTLHLAGYICKPFDPLILEQQVTRIIRRRSHRYIRLHSKGVDFPLDASDIFYMESQGHYVFIHTAETVFQHRGKLEEFTLKLDDFFLRIHASFYVNMDQITQLNASFLTLANGKTLPLSRTYGQDARKKFFMYRGSRI